MPSPPRRGSAVRAKSSKEASEFVTPAASVETVQRRRLIVLGMHRSGTSATSGLLASLGAYAGDAKDLVEPTPENPNGFFERNDVRQICDQLLESAGASWWKVSSFDIANIPHASVRTQTKAMQLVLDELDAHGTWVVKEPRLCLLLPLFKTYLRDAIAVIPVRHPLEVAQSLRRRNGISRAVGMALWELYMVMALRNSADMPRTLVSYADLIAAPSFTAAALKQKVELLGATGLRDLHDDKTIDPSLQNERAESAASNSLLSAHQQQLWSFLAKGEIPPKSLLTIDERTRIILSDFEIDRSSASTEQTAQTEMIELVRSSERNRAKKFEEELRRVEAELKSDQKKNRSLEEELAKRSVELRAESARADRAETTTSGLDAELKKLEAKLFDAKTELAVRSIELDGAHRAARAERQQADASLQEAMREKAALEKQLRAEIDGLQSSLEKRQIKADAKLRDDSAKRAALKEKLDLTERKLAKVRGDAEHSRTRVDRAWEYLQQRPRLLKKNPELQAILQKTTPGPAGSGQQRPGSEEKKTKQSLFSKFQSLFPGHHVIRALRSQIPFAPQRDAQPPHHAATDTSQKKPKTKKGGLSKPNLSELDRVVDAKDWSHSWRALRSVQQICLPTWISDNQRVAAPHNGAQSLPRPKVMIGTLHSDENEFESCKAAVSRQDYPNLEHVVFSGLPKKDAQNRLFTNFLSSDADILIKIDADMVIVDPRFVDRVVNILVAQPALAILQMAILDYYSGGEIQGVNAYTRKLQWSSDKQDNLFTDKTQVPAKEKKALWAPFLRDVIHSPNPSPFQAFHFGVHRALKVLESLQVKKPERAREQMMYLERTHDHYKIRHTRALAFACLGAERALRGEFALSDLDYTNPHLRQVFGELENFSAAELQDRIDHLRHTPVLNDEVEKLRSRRTEIAARPKIERILILLPHLNIYGGVNRFLEIAQNCREQGISATIAVLSDDKQQERVSLEYPLVECMRVKRAITQHWDAVICGDYSSGLMTLLPWFNCSLSAVYLLNGWKYKHLNEMQVSLANPDVVIANSSYSASQYPGLAPVSIPGGINLNIFYPDVSSVRAPNGVVRIGISAGRKKSIKRMDDAIAACEQLHAKGIALELHIMSATPIELETQLPFVRYEGLSRKQVADFMRSLDIFISPEEDAGWCNTAAEALACAVPVVCTCAGTTDFAIDGESALVVPIGDVNALAVATERLITDRDLATRLANRGHELIQRYSWAAVTRGLVEALESARMDSDARAAQNRKCRAEVVREIKRCLALQTVVESPVDGRQ